MKVSFDQGESPGENPKTKQSTKAARKSSKMAKEVQEPATPTNPNYRDQMQVLNNQTRELVGQARNANTKDKSEWPLVVNITYTQYEVLEDCSQETNFRLSTDEEEEWDIWWIDGPILPTLLMKMKPYQRTNHLPASYTLARKNCLAKNLDLMQQAFPVEFDFFPKTWVLPTDAKNFRE